ncbi:MAG: hypothetical protein AB7J35_18285 [Dehalococcoidia bacterium]
MALIETTSVEEAVQESGVSRATLFRWRNDPHFATALESARRALYDAALDEVREAVGVAVETLKRNLSCGNPSVEVRAASALVELGFRAKEVMDFEERVARLELERGLS